MHDLAWRSLPEAFPERGRRWHEAALKRAARRASAIVVPSQATAEAVLEAGVGISEERLAVVAEGADHLGEPDAAAGRALLQALEVRGPYLLTVSTLEPRKNLGRLVEAYASARARLPEPWPLLVVGPSGWGQSAAASRLEPVPGVIFAGALDGGTLAAIYSSARCCAYVPLLEGFGLPVVEAMSQGTPVVSSPVPSSGGASLIVEPTDPSSIADGLVAAACDEKTRASLIERGHVRAAALRWVDTARGHVAIWERVATAGAGAR